MESRSASSSPVPLLDLRREYVFMKEAIDAALNKILTHQTWILGPEVEAFEKLFCDFNGSKYGIGTSSGTEALLLALRALALMDSGDEYWSERDEVVTTAFSFTATGDTILRSRATPVFLDVDPCTFNIDLEKLDDYLASSNGRVRAVIAVHLYGRSIDQDKLRAVVNRHGVRLIEDVAQACGSSWNGRRCGAVGDIGAFSFFPSKNLGAFGDAGMVTTDDPDLAHYVRILTKHGGKDKYDVQHIGYNARLDTIQAAVLLAKLPYLNMLNTKRQAIAAAYNKALQDVPDIVTPGESGEHHCYHQYTIRVLHGRRDALKAHLDKHNIASMVYYPVPMSSMRVFSGRAKIPAPCMEAERAASEVLSLPIEPLLTEDEISRVITAVRGFCALKS
jgi:UDP-2-acetamido-2-deoxy-ribo-hexuluronate aminotransferase